NDYGIYYAYVRENLSYYYERDARDPKTNHAFTTQVDGYGNVLQTVSVAYARREGADDMLPEQQITHMTLSCSDYIALDAIDNLGSESAAYLPGLTYQTFGYEVGPSSLVNLEPGQYFDFDTIANTIAPQALASVISYDQSFTGSAYQARQLSSQQIYYSDSSLQDALSLGEATHLALVDHTRAMAFPDTQIGTVYGSRVTEQDLLDLGYETDQGHYWARGLQQYYYPASGFYFPQSIVDVDGNTTTFIYDAYDLQMRSVTDAKENSVIYDIDYQSMQVNKITDANNVISEVLFDPAGQVLVTSSYSYTADGSVVGDSPLDAYSVPASLFDPEQNAVALLSDIIARPDYYLQNASNFSYSSFNAWWQSEQTDKLPNYAIGIQRETFVSKLAVGTSSDVRQGIEYSDGFGRLFETKIKASPGPVQVSVQFPPLAPGEDATERWLSSGRQIYNNIGLPIKAYEPFYSDGHQPEDEALLVSYAVTPITTYNPLGRVIRTDIPKGNIAKAFYNTVEITPWCMTAYDTVDTVLESNYYQAVIGDGLDPFAGENLPADRQQERLENERDALRKAALIANTPSKQIQDNLGNVIQVHTQAERKVLDQTVQKGQEKLEKIGAIRITVTQYDISGNTLTQTDPRLYATGKGPNFTHTYNMLGVEIKTTSMDAGKPGEPGTEFVLQDIYGQTAQQWDARGFQTLLYYDELRRLSEVATTADAHVWDPRADAGRDIKKVVNQLFYCDTVDPSDDLAAKQAANQIGQLSKVHDQAGVKTLDEYDIRGQLTQYTQQLRTDHKQEVDWQIHQAFDEESFQFVQQYNAFGQLIKKHYPDPQQSFTEYNYLPTGELKKLTGTLHNQPKTIIDDIHYNAKGLPEKVQYYDKGKVCTDYIYEAKTDALMYVSTKRTTDQSTLQDLSYAFDPVANITRSMDRSYPTVFGNHNVSHAKLDYSYNALYQLLTARGRQHPGLTEDDRYTGFKQSRFSVNDSEVLIGYEQGYQYDLAGNMTRMVHQPDNTTAQAWRRDFTISETSNHLTQETIGQSQHDIRYDAHGNMQTLENLREIVWNHRNNIASVTIIDRGDEKLSDSEYYVYDASGQRVKKVKETLISDGIIESTETLYLDGYEIKRVKQHNLATNAEISQLERHSLRIDGDDHYALNTHYWSVDRSAQSRQDEVHFRYQFSNHLGSATL
ncbi:MAG: hypothetical protein JKY13_03240, partial [Gammaproteobacteria bacterium]|nr:hypothetical protein [Gammaproteobacteria bacterium]